MRDEGLRREVAGYSLYFGDLLFGIWKVGVWEIVKLSHRNFSLPNSG